MTSTLRPATSADEDFLFRLYAATRRAELAATGWSERECAAFLRSQYERRAQSYRSAFPEAATSIVVAGRTPIGALTVHTTPSEIRLVDLALQPEHQGSGLGTRLVRELMEDARASARPLRLHALRGSRAEAWYLRLGFTPTGVKDGYLALEWRG